MAGDGTPADALAVEIASGASVRDAADAAGVSERTAFRRLADPAFKARVAELRARMVEAAAGRLADGMGEAVGVLRSLLTDPAPGVRLRAAVKVVELGVKAVELVELERRVAELETATNPPVGVNDGA